MSRAIVIAERGGPQVLRCIDRDVPDPAPGEVQIRQTVAGINFIDTYHRSGLYPLPQLPHGIGMEAAGVVVAVGRNTDAPRIGTRVAYAGGPPGAYAEVRNVEADRLVEIPDAVSDEAAAAGLLKGMTVEYLIHRTFPVTPGMTVLWHAAAGGVGLIACQWLASLGVRVIGTVGSEAKAERAKAAGCAETILYRTEDVAERVRELTDDARVPVVFDSVGKATFAASLACLQPRGTLVSLGNASGAPDPIDPLELARGGSLYLTRPTLFDYIATREELEHSASAFFKRVASGTLKVPIHKHYPLEEAATAHADLEARASIGSLVLDLTLPEAG